MEKNQGFMRKYVFIISCTGASLEKPTINSIVRRHSKMEKVKEIQPKGLKHSRASLLINELNDNPLAVQKRLGHSNIQITLRTYSRLYPTIDREVADDLKNIIQIKTSDMPLINWNGNQMYKKKIEMYFYF